MSSRRPLAVHFACVALVAALVGACMRDYDGLFANGPSGSSSDGGGGAPDAAVPVDIDGGGSSGNPTSQCPETTTPVVPKCSLGELDRSIYTDPAMARVIQAPTTDNEDPYVPNCMTIRAGQSVTWRGRLTTHGIIPREYSTKPNPIETVIQGTEKTFTFPCPGIFNFSCRNHQDKMLGTIRVLQ